ncbi:serine-threonine protein kinase, putative, partial [Entamoeba invadens IP1]|uniref:serine-threonine protein kinase, putative n=1 Tax=Entamoeba invadens IP1 TaxID=370355 RepID=UPI0002C3D371
MAMALNKSVQCRLPLFTLFFLLFFLQRVFSMCPQGYFINTNGGCSPECIFGKKCINGCSEPNVCDECDTSFNITKNCLRCAEGFVWNGAGNCMQIPYITQCTEFLKNNQKFTYKVTKDSNFEIKVSPQDVVFSETWCSKVVPIYQPFTYGVWLQFQTSDQEELMVSIFDKSCKESSHLFFSLQKSCVLDEACLSEEKSMCISNGTKHTFTITKDPIVVFVHSAIGESILSEFSLTISVEQNQCVPSPTTIAFNDNNITTLIVDPNTFVLSRTACLQDEANIKWFSLEGVDQRVLLNLCESTYADEIALQVIDFASSGKSFNDTLCAGLSANCLNYISGNCENTKYSKIVVNGGSKTPIYIGITIPNRVNYGLIKLHVEKICPENCGFHGTCNERVGKCFCEENYVLNDQICSLCGNGILDTTEDCDDSYLTDVHCDTHTCKCYSGYSPQLVGGRVRCIIDTCGNNRIDPNESCEGGVLCERCQCQNGSYPHHPIQYGCVPETCGNGQLDVNEECDGGEGCVECLCDKQLMYFANNNIDCKNTQDRNKLISSLTPTIGLYIFLYFVLLFVYYLRYNNLNAVITKAHKEKEMYNQIIMTGIIPFSKQNAQKITKLDNPFFKISAETLDFGEDKLELNQPYYFSFTLQNLFSKVLLFTFHGVDSHKYRLTFKPPTGAIFTNETIQVKATLVMLCTTKVTEKVKVTLKYGKNKKVNKEVSQEILRKCPEVVGGTFSSSHRLTISRSSRILKKSSTLPSKVSSFYVNLRLQTESVLSSRIDLDEIEIKQPPVGQGSFGLVYEGVWRGAEVAVKMLKSDMFDTETLLPSFMEECELMERIRSPFVLGFIGSVVMPDQLCLLTEFCPLFSLRKFMKTNSMSTQLKVRICQDIAKGMDYLHQNNIVHRDLKSDNVLMVSKNPNEPVCVKISDFGTSALFVDTKSAKKIVDIGTPMYMAPEVHDKSLGNASFKCDVFSFAICILEIWLTKSPYDPDVFATPASIQEFVMSGKRPLIPKVCVYRRIIRKCWQHKPRSRPTFAEISKELDVIYQKVFEGSRSQRTSCNIGVVTTDTDTD